LFDGNRVGEFRPHWNNTLYNVQGYFKVYWIKIVSTEKYT